MFRLCLLIVFSFIAGFSANDCRFDVKLEQHLLNEGFHRNITYKVQFNNDVNKNFFEDCIVGLDQHLPPGVYSNPDELGDLRRLHRLFAVPKNRVNVELIAEESHPTSVFIISKLNGEGMSTWLPVHARYHHATSNGGFISNVIKPPQLFVRCPDRRLDKCEKGPTIQFLCNGSAKEKCTWRQLLPVSVLTRRLNLDVPVGNRSVYPLVALMTAMSLISGSLFLLKSIHEYSIMKKHYLRE